MDGYAMPFLMGAALALGVAADVASAAGQSVEEHLATARVAAGTDHGFVFNRLCSPAEPLTLADPPPMTSIGADAELPDWYADPVKVFDNLYFVGQSEYSAWAVTTSEGIILIDAIFDYSVEAQVVEGLRKLGLDPEEIRYVIVSHAHRDHAGGAAFLQERFGTRVIMSAADWDLLEASAGTWPKPVRDIALTDDHRLRLGDTELALHLTPGHTPGTVSTIIPLRDGERVHMAAHWGGTLFNFTATPEAPREHWYRAYRNSAERFRVIARATGADVLLSNHTAFDGSKFKLAALAEREPGSAHPYVIGTDRVGDFFTMASACAAAALLREGERSPQR